jgi:hypothetical protein
MVFFYFAMEVFSYFSPYGNMIYFFGTVFDDVEIVKRSVEISELEMGKLTQMLLDSLVDC